MDTGISWKRTRLSIALVVLLNLTNVSCVKGSEVALEGITQAFKLFGIELGTLIKGVKFVEDEVKKLENTTREISEFNNRLKGEFKLGESKVNIPDFLKQTREVLNKFADAKSSKKLVAEYRVQLGVNENLKVPFLELEEDVRKAFVLVQDPNHKERTTGYLEAGKKITRDQLTRVHKQRGILLRNSALKGISLSLEQQKDLYNENSTHIYDEIDTLMARAESTKDYAYVQTMLMLEIVAELRQQRQLLAALLQTQAAHNLHGDPLLVDTSPAPRKKSFGSSAVGYNGWTDEESKAMNEFKQMQEEFQRNPDQFRKSNRSER